MGDFAERLRRARRIDIAHEGITLKCVLPTEVDNAVAGTDLRKRFTLLVDAVTGWDGVTIGDVLPGDKSADDAAPFSREALEAWLSESPEVWGVMVQKFNDARVAKLTAKADVRKN